MGSDRYRKIRPIVEKAPVDCHSVSTYGLLLAGILPGRQDQLRLTGPFIEERRCYWTTISFPRRENLYHQTGDYLNRLPVKQWMYLVHNESLTFSALGGHWFFIHNLPIPSSNVTRRQERIWMGSWMPRSPEDKIWVLIDGISLSSTFTQLLFPFSLTTSSVFGENRTARSHWNDIIRPPRYAPSSIKDFEEDLAPRG